MVANTLRRKMFKLGGEVNTHGVGITSGLEYRRPGYNAGGSVVRPGPDGKNRVHASKAGFILDLLSGGATFSVKQGKKLIDDIKSATTKSKGPGEINGDGFVIPKAGPSTAAGPGILNAYTRALKSNPLATLGATGVTGTALGLPAVSNLTQYGRDMNAPNETFGQTVADFATDVGRAPVTYTAGAIPTAMDILGATDTSEALSALKGEGDAYTKFYETLYGSAPTGGQKEETVSDIKPGSDFVPTSDVMETAQTQEEQFAKMKDDADQRAEMYYAMLGGGGPDKVRALGDAFTAAGAMYDEDKSQALAGFKGGIDQELDRDETLRDEARRLAVNDIVTEDATTKQDLKAREQMVEQAKLAIMTSPDMTAEQRSSTLAGLEAFEQGVVNLLPTNDKGDELDTTNMKPGTIYLDITGLTDGRYVAVSSDNKDPDQVDSFNSISEARAHAAS